MHVFIHGSFNLTWSRGSPVSRAKEEAIEGLTSSLMREPGSCEANGTASETCGQVGALQGDSAEEAPDVEAGACQHAEQGIKEIHPGAPATAYALEGSGTRPSLNQITPFDQKLAADAAQDALERCSSGWTGIHPSPAADGGASVAKGTRRVGGGSSVLGSFLMRKQLAGERERVARQAREERDKIMSEEAKVRAANMRDRLGKLGLLDDITMLNLDRTFAPGQLPQQAVQPEVRALDPLLPLGDDEMPHDKPRTAHKHQPHDKWKPRFAPVQDS